MSLLPNAGAIWISVLISVYLGKVIPGSLAAGFRRRLWRQRDELADEVLRGVYTDRTPAKQLMRDIEDVIELAPRLSPLFIGVRRVSEVGMRSGGGARVHFGSLLPAEREKLEARTTKIGNLVATHILLETPSGWLALIVGIPVALSIALVQRLRQPDHDKSLFDDVRSRLSESVALSYSR